MELTAVAKRVSNCTAVCVCGRRGAVAIRNSEVVRYWGGVNVQYKGQQTSVPELASAIWSESVIGGVRYWRFHCIGNGSQRRNVIMVSSDKCALNDV